MTGTALKTRETGGQVGFLDETASNPEILSPPVKVRSLIFWMVFTGVALFGGFGSWAYFAPIQSAVIANGSFKVDGDLQVVQHLEGGIVRQIEVREGDRVTEGQVIAVLDDTGVQTRIGILNNRLAGTLSHGARLKAEFQQADKISFPNELTNILKNYPALDDVLEAQNALFLSNRKSDEGRIEILRNRIRQLSEQLAGIRERLRAQNEQLAMTSEEVEDLKELFDLGLTLKTRYVSRRLIESRLIGDIGQSEFNMQSVYQQIAEIEERILQVQRNRNLAIADGVQALTEEIIDIRQRLDLAREIAERLVIKAPISGRIVGFELNTIGEIIQPGQTILEIVPENSTYIVEARVSPSDIDEVFSGGTARVRLTSYSFRTTPPVEGVVSYVSAGSFFDTSSDQAFYRVNIEIDEMSLAELPNVQIIPGLPVQVMIATGELTVLTYILNPILSGLETAMLEGE